MLASLHKWCVQPLPTSQTSDESFVEKQESVKSCSSYASRA